MSESTSRRALIAALGATGACLALGAARARSAPAAAAQAPHLDVKDPAAVAQGYVENVSQVDPKKTPGFIAGSSCENCLQLQGTAGDNYPPRRLFPGEVGG